MKRGEIWWAEMPLPAGKRPVVLVSRESSYAVRSSVTVAEVSRTLRGIANEVALGPRDGLPVKCVANADNLVTIPKTWLTSCISQLSQSKSKAFDEALRFALGLG
jgi:mRNA interferase MazF